MKGTQIPDGRTYIVWFRFLSGGLKLKFRQFAGRQLDNSALFRSFYVETYGENEDGFRKSGIGNNQRGQWK